MAKRKKLNLSDNEIKQLTEISKSCVQQASKFQRAKILNILFRYHPQTISNGDTEPLQRQPHQKYIEGQRPTPILR